MSQKPEVESEIRLEELRQALGRIGDQNHEPAVESETKREELRQAWGRIGDQGAEYVGEIIYQSPPTDAIKPQELGSQLGRLVLYWDLNEPSKAQKFGHMPGDYLLVFPISDAEVNDDDIHGILNNMKGRMHYVCAQKLGYHQHGVSFFPTCYYPKEEALVVRVEPEETIVAPSQNLGS